jgi:hypothetical protein
MSQGAISYDSLPLLLDNFQNNDGDTASKYN